MQTRHDGQNLKGSRMPRFILSYHHSGKRPANPDQGADQMNRYMAWMKQHAAALTEPQNPLKNKYLVTENGSTEGGKDGSMMGYSILTADSIDHALAIVQECPFLEMGDIELAEIIDMH
jgi:hypothetical protein